MPLLILYDKQGMLMLMSLCTYIFFLLYILFLDSIVYSEVALDTVNFCMYECTHILKWIKIHSHMKRMKFDWNFTTKLTFFLNESKLND